MAATSAAESETQTAGYLVFLLFIPLFSTLWIWVQLSLRLSLRPP